MFAFFENTCLGGRGKGNKGEKDSLLNNEGNSSQYGRDLEKLTVEIANTPQAIAFFVVSVLEKTNIDNKEHYHESRTLSEALKELLNVRSVSTLGVSLALGVGASIIYWKGGGVGAGNILGDIKTWTNWSPPTWCSVGFEKSMQVSGCAQNGVQTAYTTKVLIDDFVDYCKKRKHKGNETPQDLAEEFLKSKGSDNCWVRHNDKIYHISNFVQAVAAATAPLFIGGLGGTLETTTSIISAASSIGPNYAGMESMSWTRPNKKMRPALKLLAHRLGDEINRFLRLDNKQQNQIFTDLIKLSGDKQQPIYTKAALNRLFSLSAFQEGIDTNNAKAEELNEEQDKAKNKTKEIFLHSAKSHAKEDKVGTIAGVLGILSGIGYVWETYKGTAAEADVASGIVVALLSILPYAGVGWLGGEQVGSGLISDDVPLAELYAPNIRCAVKVVNDITSVLSGGTNYDVNHQMVDDWLAYSQTQIEEKIRASKAFQAIAGALGLVGAGATNGVFTLRAIDAMLLYFAQECGSKELQRLIKFATEARKLPAYIENLSDEQGSEFVQWMLNPFEIAAWGVPQSHDPSNQSIKDAAKELRVRIHGILSEGLNDKQYQSLYDEINKENFTLPTLPRYRRVKVEGNETFAYSIIESEKKVSANSYFRNCCRKKSHKNKQELTESKMPQIDDAYKVQFKAK